MEASKQGWTSVHCYKVSTVIKVSIVIVSVKNGVTCVNLSKNTVQTCHNN